MEDNKIIELYFGRHETAITETADKYGKYLYSVAYNVLSDNEDSEESVNDTYFTAWNVIPPEKPSILSAFLAKITRNISLNKWRNKNTKKRGNGDIALAFEEIEECVPENSSLYETIETKELAAFINEFLKKLPDSERKIFICRYWYMDSVDDISERFGFSKSKVKSMLHRTRKKLLSHLLKEGVL